MPKQASNTQLSTKKLTIMEKWICKVCGYEHQGEEAPEQCPQCGCSKSEFYQDTNQKYWKTVFVMLFVTLLISIFASFISCTTRQTVDNTPVKSFNLNRFLGKWYEIARFDHRFERDMQQCTATYTIREDGTLSVINQGKKNGKWETSEGKGKLTDTPGLLKVSFFGPFYSDYRIMHLAPDYSYALVGGEDDTYLWILSRTPKLNQATINNLLREAQQRGYDTNNLMWVEQEHVLTTQP